MVRLQEVTLKLGSSGPDRLEIETRIDARGRDLLSIEYKLILRGQLLRGTIGPSLLEAASCQLEVDADRHLWDRETLPDLSLASRLEILLQELPKSDLQRICSLASRLLGQEVAVTASSPDETRHWAANVFCAQVSIFLVWMDLLHGDSLWGLMPLRLPLPYPELDQRSLSRAAFQIYRSHLPLLKLTGHPLLGELEWHLLSFLNLWGDDYQEGEGALELGVATVMVAGLLSETCVARVSSLLSHNSHLQEQLAEQQHRIASLESRLAQVERLLPQGEGVRGRVVELR